MKQRCRLGKWLLVCVCSLAVMGVRAQTNLPIYTDHLVNGFQDWSWSQIHNLANTSPVHTGASSISVYATNWQAVAFENNGFNEYCNGFNSSVYSSLVFWANGGPLGGQRIQVYTVPSSGGSPYQMSALAANTWQQFPIPLSTIGAASITNLSQIIFQLTASGTTNVFYLDDIQLT